MTNKKDDDDRIYKVSDITSARAQVGLVKGERKRSVPFYKLLRKFLDH